MLLDTFAVYFIVLLGVKTIEIDYSLEFAKETCDSSKALCMY